MSPSRTRKQFRLPILAVVIAVAVSVAIHLYGGGGDPPTALSAPPAVTGFEAVVARALPSVVQVRSSIGLGSGVVYDRAGHIVTNDHVVAGSRTFRVMLADGSQHGATLVGSYRRGDLAVVQLDGARPAPARFADSSRIRVGEYALAIGNPLGLRSSVTQGIVSSTSRTVPEGNGVTLPSAIQTSAPINPGNSGGALVDATGAVIGIPTLAALDPEFGNTAADGIGFAISSNTVRSVASRLIARGRAGKPGGPWLGVDLRGVPGVGAVVASTVASGPAARAGVRAGDAIVRVAGQPTASADDVAAALATQRPGHAVVLELAGRGGTRRVQAMPGRTPTGTSR